VASRGICCADAWHSLHVGSGRALAPGFWPPSTHGWCTLPSLTDGVCLFLTPQPANKKRWISKRRATVPPRGACSFFSFARIVRRLFHPAARALFQRLLISLLTSWSTVSVVPRTATEDSRKECVRGRDCWSAGPHDPRPCVPIPWLPRFQATPCGGPYSEAASSLPTSASLAHLLFPFLL
jgi:hypothetical protein